MSARRQGTDPRPLLPPCPECGAPTGAACASWCTGGRGRSRWFYVEVVVLLVLACLLVYMGAGGEAWPH